MEEEVVRTARRKRRWKYKTSKVRVTEKVISRKGTVGTIARGPPFPPPPCLLLLLPRAPADQKRQWPQVVQVLEMFKIF